MALDARSTMKPATEATGGAIPSPTDKSSPVPRVRERLAVIIPVHNGGEELRRCLQAVMSSATRPDEVIVVDDASTDGSAEVAQRAGAQVVRLSPPARGPAFARNRGAEIAQGEILFFADSDVLLHPDALGLALETLRGDAAPDACFGSYDDAPAAPGFVSQYKNLMHHYVHQHAAESAATFWTGCGAIRKTALQQAGGFGEDHKKPSIEDVELGIRLRRQGKRIRLVKWMKATHLKRWTFLKLLRSDILQRAVPWSRLILAEGGAPKDLNLTASARWSAIAVLLLVLTGIAGFHFPLFFLAAAILASVLLFLNRDLYGFFRRRRGWLFLLCAIPLHWFYFFYSTITLGFVAAASIPVGIFRRRVHGERENLAGAAKSSEADRGE
jgi:glycosyltransferase involved in cell wall biosynthesis